METATTGKDNFVKLRVPGEGFWAIPLPERGPDIYQIDNLLISDDYRFRDIVRADADRNVIELIERRCEQMAFKYDCPKLPDGSVDVETFGPIWDGWCDKLQEIGVELEGMCHGMVMASYPATWQDREALAKITEVVPELRVITGE